MTMKRATTIEEVGVDIGPTELIMVLAVVLLIFGGSRIPQLAKSLGEAQREFRRGVSSTATTGVARPETPPT